MMGFRIKGMSENRKYPPVVMRETALRSRIVSQMEACCPECRQKWVNMKSPLRFQVRTFIIRGKLPFIFHSENAGNTFSDTGSNTGGIPGTYNGISNTDNNRSTNTDRRCNDSDVG